MFHSLRYPLLLALALVCVTLNAHGSAPARRQPPAMQSAVVDESGQPVELDEVVLRCPAEGDDCRVELAMTVAEAGELRIDPGITELEITSTTNGSATIVAPSRLRAEPRGAPLAIRLRGRVGRTTDELDLTSPRQMRHPLLAQPDRALRIDLGWSRRVEATGISLVGGTRGSRTRALYARTQSPRLPRTGGPVLLLGAACSRDDEECRFQARAGYEVAPLSWLMVGTFAEMDSARAGGYLLVEAALPTTWATSWVVGAGPGATVGFDDGGLDASLRLQVTLQFPYIGLSLQGAIGADRRLLPAVQLSL